MSGTLRYNDFEGTVEFDAEDRLLNGRVLGISDILGYHGTTLDELEQSFRSAIDGYLEHCATICKEPQRAYSGKFVVRADASLHREAALAAARRGISLNQLVAQAILNELDDPSVTRTPPVSGSSSS